MHRLFAIVLLALLPLQFSWATVASYCAHETQAVAAHLGHHEHREHGQLHQHPHPHQADAGPGGEPSAHLSASDGAQGEKVPGADDLDCGHCHGSCGVMLSFAPALPGMLSSAPPTAFLDETGGAHAPPRPERPQWRPLA